MESSGMLRLNTVMNHNMRKYFEKLSRQHGIGWLRSKTIVARRMKEFPSFYGPRKLITVLKGAYH
jgi:hypothetical protein